MFLQIHMLQSMPPGNLNRDDTGQPKKCIFGGVTRARISSQCLKRNIRHSIQFKEAFGDDLAARTTYLPRMVADELKRLVPEVSDDELNSVKMTLAKKFKSEKRGDSENTEEDNEDQSERSSADATDQTGQLVFFQPPFTSKIAALLVAIRKENPAAYIAWFGGKKKEVEQYKDVIAGFEREILMMSKTLTVDIGMFGRMTTSNLVVNVEAACQVAHAISTHETVIESDYFTAIDDKKKDFASTQTEQTGAAFLGSGDTVTFFNSAVYYKYFNLDVDALKKHLGWQDDQASFAARVFVEAAAFANPSGKQNSFAAHGIPSLILIEASRTKRPISYANAFLKPVEGTDQLAESAIVLGQYINDVARAFQPSDIRRVLLATGSGQAHIIGASPVHTLEDMLNALVKLLTASAS
jgi:CRISPR system Cascade subunit CasC